MRPQRHVFLKNRLCFKIRFHEMDTGCLWKKRRPRRQATSRSRLTASCCRSRFVVAILSKNCKQLQSGCGSRSELLRGQRRAECRRHVCVVCVLFQIKIKKEIYSVSTNPRRSSSNAQVGCSNPNALSTTGLISPKTPICLPSQKTAPHLPGINAGSSPSFTS